MYRSTQNYENQQKMLFDGVGEYEIPQIEPTSYNPCEFLSFNYAKICKDTAIYIFIIFRIESVVITSVCAVNRKYPS